MENIQFPKKPEPIADRIEEDRIILDGMGRFPKKLIILSGFGEKREYQIKRTRRGNYILN